MVEASVLEKRLCYGTIASTLFGILLLIISIATDHWVNVDIASGKWVNQSKAYMMGHYSGLWRICFKFLRNNTTPVSEYMDCRNLKFYPTMEEVSNDPHVNEGILDYSRSETAFAIIALVLAVLANIFAIYAVKQVRYMFKRLAAMLYLITAVCIVVCLEVFQYSVEYERTHLPERHPPKSTFNYDWSFGLGWLIFIIYIIAPIIMFVTSRKRKGEKARTEHEAMENEPVILGRVG